MEYTRTIRRRFEAGGEPLLRVQSRTGAIEVRGEDRADIEVEATLYVSADSADEGRRILEALTLPTEQVGGTLQVGPPSLSEDSDAVASWPGALRAARRLLRSHAGLGWRVEVVARVPRTCGVEAYQRAGSVSVTGVDHAEVESRSGAVDVRNVRGNVRIASVSGHVGAHDVGGRLTVEQRAGRVEADHVSGEATIDSVSGQVVVRGVSGALRVDSVAGRVVISEVGGPLRIASASGSVEYSGRLAQSAEIEIGTGSARLAISPDSSFFLDAETATGSVRCDLPIDGLRPSPGKDGPIVRIRAGTGSVRVEALEPVP